MQYVLLAALCSVLVSVLLKLARRFDIDVGQAVAWNYVAALALALLVLQPPTDALRGPAAPWFALAALGLLLPTIFLALAASVRHAGIVRSDAAQRLSLLIPLLAAFTVFGQPADGMKLLGCALGLLALGCRVWRGKQDDGGGAAARWQWPLAVFAGFGLIDVLFKRVAAAGLPLGSSLLAVFALALVVAFAIQFARRARFTLRSALGGLLLGACHFATIAFYLQAHRALPERPALVFASMNLGVVALGALVGVALFRERLGRLNVLGLLLAFVAIALLARA